MVSKPTLPTGGKQEKRRVCMPKLKNRIIRYLVIISSGLTALLLVTALILNITTEHRNVRKEASVFFEQIDRVLVNNQNELTQARDEYYTECIKKAHTAAYMVQKDPTQLESLTDIQRLADLLDVEEINIFNEKGVIVAGNVPTYYGASMANGGQLGYFTPMLADKSLEMVQEPTQNLAEQKEIPYSAVWSEDGKFIMQIGMKPVDVLRLTAKRDLSRIFSLLNAGIGVTLYACEPDTHIIEGSTDAACVGKTMDEVGLPVPQLQDNMADVHANIGGNRCYCVYTELEGSLIAYTITQQTMMSRITGNFFLLLGAMLFIAGITVISVTWYLNRYVIRSINSINASLRKITLGNLSEKVAVYNTAEFAQLSGHINDMIDSLLSTTDIISYIINKADMPIGVYVYNLHMKTVRFTDYIPDLLRLTKDEMNSVSSDYHLFRNFIDTLREMPLEGEKNTYMLNDGTTRYIRIEETEHDSEVLGVVIDMTEDVARRMRLETERNIDLLTGILNRRGFDEQLIDLFSAPEKMGWSAYCVIDADNLKIINDTHGHENGDLYLKTLSDAIRDFGSRQHIAGRLGGDEFAVLLYGYDDPEAVEKDAAALALLQDSLHAVFNGKDEPVRFSLGCVPFRNETDHSTLLRKADALMYENKRLRKQQRDVASTAPLDSAD